MAVIRAVVVFIFAAAGAICAQPAAATAFAASNIDLLSLSMVPSVGTISLNGPWSLQAFASANNSLGENAAQFGFASSPGSAGAAASVTWAAGSAAAGALHDPPNLDISAGAASNVQIPGCGDAAAFSEGHGTLSVFFTISGAGMVGVQLGAGIAGALQVATDSCGLRAFTQTIFTLAVDGGDPLLTGLFDLRSLLVGPNASLSESFSEFLSNEILLTAGEQHFLLLQVDSESSAQLMSEPSTGALLLAALLMCMLMAGRGLTQRRRALVARS
jgi:hypothetical protein